MAACTSGGPASVNETSCGSGSGGGGGGGSLAEAQQPVVGSSVERTHENQVRSTVTTTSRSWCCE